MCIYVRDNLKNFIIGNCETSLSPSFLNSKEGLDCYEPVENCYDCYEGVKKSKVKLLQQGTSERVIGSMCVPSLTSLFAQPLGLEFSSLSSSPVSPYQVYS